MPTYEFSCPICNVVIEQTFSVYTDHIISCETCKVEMNKRFAPPAVIFKGTGFYKTGG